MHAPSLIEVFPAQTKYEKICKHQKVRTYVYIHMIYVYIIYIYIYIYNARRKTGFFETRMFSDSDTCTPKCKDILMLIAYMIRRMP
jgi:hypothetical protein